MFYFSLYIIVSHVCTYAYVCVCAIRGVPISVEWPHAVILIKASDVNVMPAYINVDEFSLLLAIIYFASLIAIIFLLCAWRSDVRVNTVIVHSVVSSLRSVFFFHMWAVRINAHAHRFTEITIYFHWHITLGSSKAHMCQLVERAKPTCLS